MTSREIRRSFLDFFERNGHRVVPSSSLVPVDDPTLLFTNAGMNQFKDVFLGRERREYRRAATSQKCMRVSGKHNDLDNVGPSLRHHTFFEMLGNFSFGDYFKAEALELAWTLLTGDWALDPDHLFATIFCGEAGIPRDDEAFALWRRFLPADRIHEFGVADNFWQMGDTGPCGRCSEVHYFRGPHIPCAEETAGGRCQGLACSCDRYVEIWNNVFMEFDRQQDGAFDPLPAPSIDTGMGLERITAVMQGTLSNYDTDLFRPIIESVEERTGRPYGPYQPKPADLRGDVPMRVVADHLRAMTFLIADGVLPSNEWRGYVLRKIMRRAMRHGRHLDLREPFLHSLVDVLIARMGEAYPELGKNRDAIVRVVLSEEERFDAVLAEGLPRLESAIAATLSAGGRILEGQEAFKLYDTYGLPYDFIEDTAGTNGITVDRARFEAALEDQRGRARAGSAFDMRKGQSFTYRSNADREALSALGDSFEGYSTAEVEGLPVLALFDEQRQQVSSLSEGETGYVVLERTPFYVEAGGQVSDTGQIVVPARDGHGTVDAMTRLVQGGPRAHHVAVTNGQLCEGDLAVARVDAQARDATRRNHTATHLLHAALRQVLGSHVKQAGSLVAPARLRFDFVHFSPLTKDEVVRIERLVDAQIRANSPVETEVRPTQDAIAAGAMALFGEKYGDRVRVVSVPGFSTELCGGTHCRATGDIGLFVITQETGIAAGVRRVEALTGGGALAWVQAQRAAHDALLDAVGAPDDQAVDSVQRLQGEVKRLTRELNDLKMKSALGPTGAADEAAIEVRGVKVLTRKVDGLDKTALRSLADSLKARLGSGVVVIGSTAGDKVTVVVAVTPDLTTRVSAGRLVKELAPMVGGGGGGRPDFAEAGGRHPDKLEDMLRTSPALVDRMLAG